MSDTLLIHYNPDAPARISWLLCNDQNEPTTKVNSGSMNDVAEIARTHAVVILLDSHCLHINSVELPTQNMQKMLRAVPYALEDYIAEDVEDFHFVITADKQLNKTAVAGIKKQTLQSVIDAFDEAGIYADTILADVLCLAGDQHQWALLKHEGYSYFHTARFNGSIFNQELSGFILEQALQSDNLTPPEKCLVFTNSEDPEADEYLQSVQQIITDNTADKDEAGTEVIGVSYNSHPLVVFCGFYRQALPLNLRQGSFKPRRKSSGYWQHWKMTAVLAAIWLSLHLGFTAFQYNRISQENTEIHAKVKQIYKKTFPASKKVVNPRAQMEQQLKALRSGSKGGRGLLYLLSESFGTLSHDKKSITLQSLNYRNNRMDIGLDGTNLQAIENLNKQLNKNTLIKAEITSSSSEKNRVKGNLRIEARSRENG